MQAQRSRVIKAENNATWSAADIDTAITKSCQILTENIDLLQSFKLESMFSDEVAKTSILRVSSQYFAMRGSPLAARIRLRNMQVKITFNKSFISLAVKIFSLGTDKGLPQKYVRENGELNTDIYRPTRNILTFLFNYSDHSEEFASAVVKEALFLKCLIRHQEELRPDFIQKTLNKDVYSMLRVTISCAYNFMMHENAADVLLIRESNMLESVKPYLKCNSDDDHFMMTILFFLAYCVDEKEAELFLSERKVIDYFLKLLQTAFNDSYKRARGYSVIELSKGLERLAKNDTNKKQLVEQGVLNVLTLLVGSTDPRECELAFLILWTLSFDDSNKAPIRKEMDKLQLNISCADRNFVRQEDESEETFNETIERCEKARLGTLWVLGGDDQSLTTSLRAKSAKVSRARPAPPEAPGAVASPAPPPPPPGMPSVNSKPAPTSSSSLSRSQSSEKKIMLSYSWSQKPIVLKIADELKSKNLSVWIDVDQMANMGNTLDSMANAVESSDIILVAMSQAYKTGQNTRMEAEYAYRRNKVIIPLVVEPKYRADGWLGFMMGNRLYFDFSGKYPFNKKMEELLKSITGNSDSIDGEIDPVKINETSKPAEQSNSSNNRIYSGECRDPSVSSWSNLMVKNWIKKNDIPQMQLTTITGKHLVFLKRVHKESPDFFYRCLENHLNLSTLDSIVQFVKALEEL